MISTGSYFTSQRMISTQRRNCRLIEERSERLAEHPFMYRPGRLADTREAVIHPNYILVYRVHGDVIDIVNVLHSRRQYPPADA